MQRWDVGISIQGRDGYFKLNYYTPSPRKQTHTHTHRHTHTLTHTHRASGPTDLHNEPIPHRRRHTYSCIGSNHHKHTHTQTHTHCSHKHSHTNTPTCIFLLHALIVLDLEGFLFLLGVVQALVK